MRVSRTEQYHKFWESRFVFFFLSRIPEKANEHSKGGCDTYSTYGAAESSESEP